MLEKCTEGNYGLKEDNARDRRRGRSSFNKGDNARDRHVGAGGINLIRKLMLGTNTEFCVVFIREIMLEIGTNGVLF